jgi:alpha-L-arabinofuranosidase
MDEYVQEVLDLIEWANGDAKTTAWGRKRAEAGHPKPFNLKYIGVGNEDLISEVFEERFTMIYDAIREKHPEITVIGTVGPFFEGSDYDKGWEIAERLDIPIVDEHYYQTPGWFIHNQDFYDRYDRSKSKVYLGEYAAHLPGRPNNLETALAEAIFLTSLERNGDVVIMTSYAPLLAKERFTNWNPDLIYFNNTEVKPTVGYHVQKLYGENAGNEYLPSEIQLSGRSSEAVRKRLACSVVRDSRNGDVIIKLANLLPVAVKVALDTGELEVKTSNAVKTVLTGNPADKDVQPVQTIINMQDVGSLELPAYSFTVIRF